MSDLLSTAQEASNLAISNLKDKQTMICEILLPKDEESEKLGVRYITVYTEGVSLLRQMTSRYNRNDARFGNGAQGNAPSCTVWGDAETLIKEIESLKEPYEQLVKLRTEGDAPTKESGTCYMPVAITGSKAHYNGKQVYVQYTESLIPNAWHAKNPENAKKITRKDSATRYPTRQGYLIYQHSTIDSTPLRETLEADGSELDPNEAKSFTVNDTPLSVEKKLQAEAEENIQDETVDMSPSEIAEKASEIVEEES